MPARTCAAVRSAVSREPGRRVRVGLERSRRRVTISDLICDLARWWLAHRDALDLDYDRLVFEAQDTGGQLAAYMDDDLYDELRTACADEQLRRSCDGYPALRVTAVAGILRGLLTLWLRERDVLDGMLAERRRSE
ncbi:MAG: hypothetical protein MR874_07825 [Coriobacteriaceae bacterium]|uniref:hypothetical protein n=1 Tax=Tractidigestivibacter sp. TaxID=2847320 RepID=UPI002A80F192|nr:hypothetical protein [Tractidigestivibacter sp.]MCI6547864.1 hypothetical protein [Coriobacteriaceae bacterium]MCI6844647.1 hypothetical protein [Coriobacteriaceae bacterium]MDD7584542.1 hypothetical protein [Coriobacteriaceae bacterium]MDY4535572.1 hypothetical protein [Tractidigestivibacter sp.]